MVHHLVQALFVCLKVVQFFYLNASHLVGKAWHKQRIDCFLHSFSKERKGKRKSMKNLGKNSKSRERLEKKL